jgi:hypothetical protein
MPKIIDFKTPTTDGIVNAIGTIAWLPVGPRKIKFVLQREERNHDAHLLTHYASGRIVAKLNAIRLARYVANPYSFPAYRDRDFAMIALEQLIASHGEGKLLAMFDAAEVINA